MKAATLAEGIHKHGAPGAMLYIDTAAGYNRVPPQFVHEQVDHARQYVAGRCHTNSLENFWTLFKRGLKGTCVSIDAPHLGRYVEEQVFRFNERKDTTRWLNFSVPAA